MLERALESVEESFTKYFISMNKKKKRGQCTLKGNSMDPNYSVCMYNRQMACTYTCGSMELGMLMAHPKYYY